MPNTTGFDVRGWKPRLHINARPIRSLTSAAEIPTTRTTLFRLVWPVAIITAERGTRKISEKNSTHAAFAFPSTGGAVSATFNASPNWPTIAFRFARGCTLIANVTPAAVSLIEITSYMISRVSCERRAVSVEQSEFACSQLIAHSSRPLARRG